MLEFARGFAGVGENRGAVSVGGFVRQFDRVIEIVHAHDVQHRAENFFARDRHVVLHLIDNRRAHVKIRSAHPATFTPRPSAMIFAPSFSPLATRLMHAIAMLRGDDRAHVGLRFAIGRTDFDRARGFD